MVTFGHQGGICGRRKDAPAITGRVRQMDWMDQVLEKAKRKNQILFSKDLSLIHI